MDILVRIRREQGTKLFGGTARISGGVIIGTIILPFTLSCTLRSRPRHLQFLRQGQTIWELVTPRLTDVLLAAKDPGNRAFVPLMTCVFEAHLQLISGQGMECYHSCVFENPIAELEAAVREVFCRD